MEELEIKRLLAKDIQGELKNKSLVMPPALLGARFSFGNQSTPPPLPRSWLTDVVCEKSRNKIV
ncbi:4193_t:CDS:2 [Entrophospora sp. SA101]|nr:4193_t:CDS:2 [Entrophospora sp. SA101]